MNYRNKWAVHIVRSLLGLMMLAMGILGMYFIVTGTVIEVPGSTEATKAAETGLNVSGITLVVKVFEIVVGLMLLFNFRPALANLLLAPIIIGIMTYDIVLWRHVPSSMIPALFVLFACIYLGYVYWEKYQPLFEK